MIALTILRMTNPGVEVYFGPYLFDTNDDAVDYFESELKDNYNVDYDDCQGGDPRQGDSYVTDPDEEYVFCFDVVVDKRKKSKT